MPYASMKDINPALKGIKPKITLAQANVIAKWADKIKAAGTAESPWAVAIAQFKKSYRAEGGKWVKKKVKEAARGYFTSGTATVEISALNVDGEKVPVSELVAAYQEQQGEPGDQGEPGGQGEVSTTSRAPAAESENGFTEYVSGGLEDYAMSVKDAFRVAFKPTTVSPGGEIGYDFWPRDVFKDDPSLGSTVVVRAEDSFLYAVEYEEADEGFRFATRDNWRKVVLTYVPVETEAAEVAEAQLSESASGHVISLAEAQAVTGGPRAPLLMDVALIKPGWGNKKDNHYYSPELLRRDAEIFEGVKMYTSNHKPDQKSVRTEVSVIKKITGFTGDGAPIASVAVHDPDFAEATRNRAKLGTLDSLECSILAGGRVRKGKVGDRKGNIVEAITSAASVDWVTKAGAGGHAIALAESNTGGVNMEKDQVKQLLSESDLPQDVQERLVGVEYENEEAVKEAILAEAKDGGGKPKPEPVVYLAKAEIKTLLEASRLPKQAQERLAEGQYLDVEALKTVVETERAYIKELTGSGKPFAQGESASTDATMTEADYDKEYNDILSRHGLHVQEVGNA